MLDKTGTLFSHVKPSDTQWRGDGLRDFFLYRDLGVADATHGKVLVQLVKAHSAPERGTGWHRHEAVFHIVVMLKGWARFMYEDHETLVAAGDCVCTSGRASATSCSTIRRTWSTWRSFRRLTSAPSTSRRPARYRSRPPGRDGRGARQNSASSSSISIGSFFAAVIHSTISGIVTMVWQ